MIASIGGRASGLWGNQTRRTRPSRPMTASAPSWRVSSVAAQQPGVHRNRAGGPHLADRAAARTEELVQDAVDVGEHREPDFHVVAEGGEPPSIVGERDDDGECVAHLSEVIAHGDHVFLAGQSSQVAVQDQHDRPTAMVLETPRVPFVIDEADRRNQIALADHVQGDHARLRSASSTPRWNVG